MVLALTRTVKENYTGFIEYMEGILVINSPSKLAGTVLKRIATIKGVPLPIMIMICESSFRRLFGQAN